LKGLKQKVRIFIGPKTYLTLKFTEGYKLLKPSLTNKRRNSYALQIYLPI